MKVCYVTYKSITASQRAVSALEKAGVPASLMRTPKNMATEGCGYAVKLRGDKLNLALRQLRAEAPGFGKVFTLTDKGYEQLFI